MKARQKRLIFVALAIVGVGFASILAIQALRSNAAYLFIPSKVLAGEAPKDHVFRLGGLVEAGSMERQEDGLTVHFSVTDEIERITVAYTGILPDLFGEGQGVVAKGRLGEDGTFYAEEVLAKHDESYMPPELQDELNTAHAEGVAQQAAATGAGQ